MSNASTTTPIFAADEPCDHYYAATTVRRAHGYLGDAPAGTIEILCADCGALTGTLPAAMTLADAQRFVDLGQSIDFGAEAYGETVAQYRAECAHYGDAWPGAAIEVAAMRDRLAADEAAHYHLRSVYGMLAAHGPAVPAVYDPTEPF